jgi:hypothetical protein
MLSLVLVCKAQDNWERVADSMGMVSRAYADKVLAQFDTIQSPKLLYSLDDRDFYLIIKDSVSCKEYYISLSNSGGIDKIQLVKDETKNKKQRKQKEQYQKKIEDAKPFDLNQYHTGFITNMPAATHTSGRHSYFVVKDIYGKRYGEYRLSVITAPSPINGSLWIYLIRRLSDEVAKSYNSLD